jgi:hypothetical protein
MFTGNRLPDVISTICHLRKQKITKYFLLNGYDFVFDSDHQNIPILKLKQNHSIYKAPSELQDETKWTFNKTGRLVYFNECDYEFNAKKNKTSYRIHCNPYDDIQVDNFLSCLKDEEHFEEDFDEYLYKIKIIPKTEVLLYGDRYVFNGINKSEISIQNKDHAAGCLAEHLKLKLKNIIDILIEFDKKSTQFVFICLNRDSFETADLSIQENQLNEFKVLLDSKLKQCFNEYEKLIVQILVSDIHDRFIISDYFLIRSTTSMQTKWSNVNYQGVSQNLGEYFKGVKHIVFGKWKSYQKSDSSIPQIQRIIKESMIITTIKEQYSFK